MSFIFYLHPHLKALGSGLRLVFFALVVCFAKRWSTYGAGVKHRCSHGLLGFTDASTTSHVLCFEGPKSFQSNDQGPKLVNFQRAPTVRKHRQVILNHE